MKILYKIASVVAGKFCSASLESVKRFEDILRVDNRARLCEKFITVISVR